jgi:poly-gamma-glutamate synthesis protein (capsule biosynthesis protein)
MVVPVLAVVLVASLALWVPHTSRAAGIPVDQAANGVVLSAAGSPIAGATIRVGRQVAVSDLHGHYTVAAPSPELIQVSADGYLPRTAAVGAGRLAEIVLTPAAAGTVSLRFGGDVMFGRRFYEPNDDGIRLLRDRATAADHAALLGAVEPLLQDADLTVVNLETPLMADPYYDPTKPRPARFHPSKGLAFASAPASAEGLKLVGVDAVDLGNNHTYDGLGPGLASTLAVLDRARMPHFGAGATVADAWKPAILMAHGQRVAYVGCTTVSGQDEAISYVADETKGGAARCTGAQIQSAVRAARTRADIVVMMIHGAVEYQREQVASVRALTAKAIAAGAAVVVNGHPHVTGAVSMEHGALVAETMGNLLFDQTLWATFNAYLLRVDVRDGVPVHSSIDPLAIDRYRPYPVVGPLANAAGRIAASLPAEATRLTASGADVGVARPITPRRVDLTTMTARRLAPGTWVSALPRQGGVRLGQDLLWGTGDFERVQVGKTPITPTVPAGADLSAPPEPVLTPALWDLGLYARLGSGASCGSNAALDRQGLELARSPVSSDDVTATATHRIGVTAGAHLSMIVDVREASAGSTMELRWYRGATGASVGVDRLTIPVGTWPAAGCGRVRLDVTVPPSATFVQPFLRLSPPDDSIAGPHLRFDNVKLVAWAPAGTTGRALDTIEATAPGSVTVMDDRVGSRAHSWLDTP